MFDHENGEDSASVINSFPRAKSGDKRSKVRLFLYIRLRGLPGRFRVILGHTVILGWLCALTVHAIIVGSLDSRQQRERAEIECGQQAEYDLEKPKRRLTLSDDGELVPDKPKHEQNRS
jgi:hypothetical protein